ncbi:MAG: hypothetical protein ACK4IB_07300 [Erythrobacter sp.]
MQQVDPRAQGQSANKKPAATVGSLPDFCVPLPGARHRVGKLYSLLSRGGFSSSVSSFGHSFSAFSGGVSSGVGASFTSFFNGFFNSHGVCGGVGGFFSSRRASDGGNGQTSNGDQSRKLLHGAFPHK